MGTNKFNERKFLIFISIPVSAVMIFILYSMLFKKADKTNIANENKSKSSALILPDVKDDTSKAKESKSALYDELDQKDKAKKEQENLQSSKDFFDMNEKNVQNNDAKPQNTGGSNITTKGSGNSVSYENNNTSGRKYNDGSASQYYQQATPVQTQASNSVQQTNNRNNSDNGYSFGVYRNPSATVRSNSDAAAIQQNDFIPAILENSQKIKSGSEVVFLLQNDSYINGLDYEKLSVMYGIASFSGGRMDITINTIQDKTGQKHPVNLIGYNENYQKGVYYSDADANMKQGKSNVVSSTANGVANSLTSGASGDVVNGVVQTAVSALSNSKAEVNVSEGYKMYFK